MGEVLQLRIPRERQDNLASLLDQLKRQNQEASWRKEVLECIAKAEEVIMHHEQVIFYGRELLKQMDERGPV